MSLSSLSRRRFELSELQKQVVHFDSADVSFNLLANNCFIFLLSIKLKTVAEKMPPEDSNAEILRSLYDRAEDFLDTTGHDTSESSSFQAGVDRHHRNISLHSKKPHIMQSHGSGDHSNSGHSSGHSHHHHNPDSPSASSTRDDDGHPSSEDSSTTPRNEKGKEVIEQFEPGVYVTLILLQNSTKVFRRVKFR